MNRITVYLLIEPGSGEPFEKIEPGSPIEPGGSIRIDTWVIYPYLEFLRPLFEAHCDPHSGLRLSNSIVKCIVSIVQMFLVVCFVGSLENKTMIELWVLTKANLTRVEKAMKK